MNGNPPVSDLPWEDEARRSVWDALWNGRPIGRPALAVMPNAARVERAKRRVAGCLDPTAARPPAWTPRWQDALISELVAAVAQMELPGDGRPGIKPPRFVHRQSQGIADVFGVRVEELPDGRCYAHPVTPDPARIESLQPRPVTESAYWGAMEWTRYANSATGAQPPFRNPVMTGPMDTACYVLGATTLMEWVFTAPDALHRLLDKITDVLTDMMGSFLRAAGPDIGPLHFSCTRGGFDLCSEVRSLVSRETFEEFEAPQLRRLGERLGPFAIHSCGSWERTVPATRADPNIRGMNGQSKENDLPELCRLADGGVLLSIRPSVRVHDRYLWPDTEGFLRHVLQTVPEEQPFEAAVGEDDLALWLGLYREVRGKEFALLPPLME